MWGLISKPLMRWFSWHPQFCLTFFYVPRLPNPISMHPWFCIHSRLVFSTFLWKILEVNLRQGWVFIWKMPSFFQKGLIFFKKCSVFWPKMFIFFSKCSPKSSVSGLCLNLVMLFFTPETLVYWAFPLRQEVLLSGSVFPLKPPQYFFPQFFFGAEFFENVKRTSLIYSVYTLFDCQR